MPAREDVFADHHWETRAGGKMLLYFGPHINETLDQQKLRDFLKRRGAWGAYWNYGWNREDGPWYAFVCDTENYDLDKISSKNSRKSIRRSLERCAVRRIEPAWLAENGYGCYKNATERYTDFTVWTEAEFKAEMRKLADVPGVIMHAVHVGDDLAAYGIAYDVGNSVRFREAFFDPQFSHDKPMYALYYVLANECLNGQYQHIDAGWRPLVHDTNIEEFFRRMGWRHAPCHIGLCLNWKLKLMLTVARLFKAPVKALLPKQTWLGIEALLVASDAARKSS